PVALASSVLASSRMNNFAQIVGISHHLSLLDVPCWLSLLGLQCFLLSVFIPNTAQLKRIADRIYNRMRGLGLNETQLSERCSLAALHLFEADQDAPTLSRDRVAKILMNRQDTPAKSAARVITYPELRVLASVLRVSPEWLIGQNENRDPVVWNVLAQPDRFQSIANLVQDYEESARQTTIWSRHPAYPLITEDFSRALNQIRFGRKDGLGNRPLVEFYNTVARARRKWIQRTNRPFAFVNVMFKTDLEQILTGSNKYSTISKTILARNLQFMIDTLSNESLNIKLIIAQEESVADTLRNYESLAVTDNLFSFWNYHNGDVGWSEHPCYTAGHHQLLNQLMQQALNTEMSETVEFLQSLRVRNSASM